MTIRTLALALAVTVGCSFAQAATVKFTLDNSAGDGTFSLYATELDGAADNGGIASYGALLTGNITSLMHVSPFAQFANPPGGGVGFDQLRSAAGVAAVGATQNTITPVQMIYGFGQRSGSFAEENIVPQFNSAGETWNADLLIATGTYTGDIGFNETDALTFANVFAQASGTATVGADLQFVIGPLGGGGDGPDLGPGGALDFGYNGQTQVITLTNTGDETANFLGDQFEITGVSAGLFSLVDPNFDPIPAGGSRGFNVLFNSGSNAQASYSAALTFLTDAGTNPVFALTAQVPEPSTVALAGLGMVGLVGLARRRRK